MFPIKKFRLKNLACLAALLLILSDPATGQYHNEPEALPWADRPKQIENRREAPRSATEPPDFPGVPEKVPTGPAGWLLLGLGSFYAVGRLKRDRNYSAHKKTYGR